MKPDTLTLSGVSTRLSDVRIGDVCLFHLDDDLGYVGKVFSVHFFGSYHFFRCRSWIPPFKIGKGGNCWSEHLFSVPASSFVRLATDSDIKRFTS